MELNYNLQHILLVNLTHLTFPTGNVTADKFLKVASVSGSGTTGVGQLSFDDAGGTHTLLSTTNVTSAVSQVDISYNIDSTYKIYMITLHRIIFMVQQITLYTFFQGGSVDTGSVYDS